MLECSHVYLSHFEMTFTCFKLENKYGFYVNITYICVLFYDASVVECVLC